MTQAASRSDEASDELRRLRWGWIAVLPPAAHCVSADVTQPSLYNFTYI